MWTNKTRLLTYTLLHTSQTTGALEPSEWRSLGTLSCTVLMWRFRWVFWVNFHEHWSHSNGLSPVWLLWWLCRNKSNWFLNTLFLHLGKFKDSGYMANNDYAIKNHSSYKPPSHAWSRIFFRNLNSCISSRVAYPWQEHNQASAFYHAYLSCFWKKTSCHTLCILARRSPHGSWYVPWGTLCCRSCGRWDTLLLSQVAHA